MDLGYCSQCKKNVPVDRPPFNVCLFCVLLFTGIGAVIYLIIWLAAMPKNRCTFCHSTTMPAIREGSNPSLTNNSERYLSAPNQPSSLKNSAVVSSTKSETGDLPTFCPFCGTQLRTGATFCPECGGNVHDRANK